jgi:tRNA (cmo5U34)-methyltransferase
MAIGDSFNETVQYYDSWMRTALPDYDALFGTAKALAPFAPEQPITVLDLGAGTGSFSWHILNRYPCARFTLVDLAEKLLETAQKRFAAFDSQFAYCAADYRDLSGFEAFDLVISSLSIHHLADDEKAALFQQVFNHLNPGGVFLNIDQVKGPTPEIQELYWSQWLETVRKRGAAEEQVQSSIQRRKTFDQDALMTDQLRWLEEAGFSSVDCVYKNYFVGVFYAVKG